MLGLLSGATALADDERDRQRAAPGAQVQPLQHSGKGFRQGVVSVSHPLAAQAGAFFGRAPLLNLGAELTDFADTMAILDCVDLLVSVDTSVVHLAGAMGRPAWVLLPRAPDWRWLLDREDTPWYPSLRLFRQDTSRRYRPLIAQAAAEARALFATRV